MFLGDSGWRRRGEFAGGGRRRRTRKLLDGGCRVRYAVGTDGRFSLKRFLRAAVEDDAITQVEHQSLFGSTFSHQEMLDTNSVSPPPPHTHLKKGTKIEAMLFG